MKDLNSYLCDHFPLRDFFIGMKSKAEIAVGKREIYAHLHGLEP
jgi:hypothetical protein